MGEGEVTQKFAGGGGGNEEGGGGGGGVSKKNKEGTKFQRWARRLLKKGHLKDYVQQTRTYEMAVK